MDKVSKGYWTIVSNASTVPLGRRRKRTGNIHGWSKDNMAVQQCSAYAALSAVPPVCWRRKVARGVITLLPRARKKGQDQGSTSVWVISMLLNCWFLLSHYCRFDRGNGNMARGLLYAT